MPFAWTPAALDVLHRLYVREGCSARTCAEALGTTRNAVLGKAQRMGWSASAPPKPGRKPKPEAARKPRLVRPPPSRTGPFARDIPLPELREIAVLASRPRPWAQREEGQCAFPVGEPDRPERQFSCCAPTGGRRKTYCPGHLALMRLPETALTRQDQAYFVEFARRVA